MKVLNIVVCGVGGQGLLTMARLLAEAALARGMDVAAAETHGMSQRGGSVIVYLRIGEKVYAPTFSRGQADMVLSTELVETLRNCVYMNRGTRVVTNTKVIYPAVPGVYSIRVEPSKAIEWLRQRVEKVFPIPASDIAMDCGNPQATNMVILGAASILLSEWIDAEKLRELVSKVGRGRVAEANLRAFERGQEEMRKLLEEPSKV